MSSCRAGPTSSRLQELRRGGVPVHHGVPVLRHAAPQARAEARARRRAEGAAQRAALAARSCRGCGRARSRASAPTGARGRVVAARRSRRVLVTVGARSPGLLDLRRLRADRAGVDDPWRRVHDARSPTTRPATRSSPLGDDRAVRLAARAPPRLVGAAARLPRRAARAARTSSVAVDDEPIALGGNGAALGLLAAWAMRDLLGRRRGGEDDSDLLGVLAIARRARAAAAGRRRTRSARRRASAAASSGSCSGCCLAPPARALARTRDRPGRGPATRRPTTQPSISRRALRRDRGEQAAGGHRVAAQAPRAARGRRRRRS